MTDSYDSLLLPRDVGQVLRMLTPLVPICPAGGALRMEHVECSIEPLTMTIVPAEELYRVPLDLFSVRLNRFVEPGEES